MNYLAHLYLSGKNKEILLGNFIADVVKGKKYLDFPPSIAKGIIIHRFIDHHTDTHPNNSVVRKIFQPYVGKYSGVVLDIIYDHFLAKTWDQYHSTNLSEYCREIYLTLKQNLHVIPSVMHPLTQAMISQNWLYNYRDLKGIENALTGLSGRTRYPSNLQLAMEPLQRHYNFIQHSFHHFFINMKLELYKKFPELT